MRQLWKKRERERWMLRRGMWGVAVFAMFEIAGYEFNGIQKIAHICQCKKTMITPALCVLKRNVYCTWLLKGPPLLLYG